VDAGASQAVETSQLTSLTGTKSEGWVLDGNLAPALTGFSTRARCRLQQHLLVLSNRGADVQIACLMAKDGPATSARQN
jgi:hypothetical protein